MSDICIFCALSDAPISVANGGDLSVLVILAYFAHPPKRRAFASKSEREGGTVSGGGREIEGGREIYSSTQVSEGGR